MARPAPQRLRRLSRAGRRALLAAALAAAGGCDRLDPSWEPPSALADPALPGGSGARGMRRLLAWRPAAPRVRLVAEDGETATIEQFAGRVIVLALWAHACEPCRSNLASLERLAEQMPAVAIVPVRLDAPGAMVQTAGAAPGSLPAYHDPDGRIARLFGAQALPASFVIDRRGRIAAIVEGTADWTSAAMLALLLRV